MKLVGKTIDVRDLSGELHSALREGKRLGLLTSIDGAQLVALVLVPQRASAELWQARLEETSYPSLTTSIPQLHWFERALYDMFGLTPKGHPRLKPLVLHEPYLPGFHPLSRMEGTDSSPLRRDRKHHFLEVKGEGVYELPVGPIHAGIIEPGHFRFSCFGETIVNLETQLGWVHRGIEQRITEVPWSKARFLAESAAGDTPVANALAHAILVESLLGTQASARAQYLRTLALEIERLAMHIIDLGGLAGDIGMVALASSFSRLRGQALSMGEALSGSRFMKGFVIPGGVRMRDERSLSLIQKAALQLERELETLLQLFFGYQAARDRMDGIGAISRSLALEFGLVGVAARSCGIEYDTRTCFAHGAYPAMAEPPMLERGGDILARARVRQREVAGSLRLIRRLLDDLPAGEVFSFPGEILPPDATAWAIVEAFRGELIHFACTDGRGCFRRYAIKDPSFNNWTALSIAIRNNLIADFPLCNKSLSLSYSGNDL